MKEQATEPFALEHTLTVADLAPNGLHQMIVSATTAYAIGQRTDGSVEVATVGLGTKEKRSYTSAPAGGWSVVLRLGDWVAVVSVPAANGSRSMFVANAVTDESATATLGNGERVTLQGTSGGAGTALLYIAHSANANTARYGTVDGTGDVPGTPAPLPAGARPLYTEKGALFIDSGGRIWTYSSAGLRETQAKVPPGPPDRAGAVRPRPRRQRAEDVGPGDRDPGQLRRGREPPGLRDRHRLPRMEGGPGISR